MRHLKQKSGARKRTNSFLQSLYFKPLLFSAAMGLVAAVVTYGIKSGLNDLAQQEIDQFSVSMSKQAGFKINDVWIEGRENTPIKDLRSVINLELDQPIFQADPDYLRTRIEALPWIARASVERRLPDIVHIKLYEHRPIALWQHQRTFSLINAKGDVILTGGDDINVFSHLPLVVGEGAPKHAEQILSVIRSEPSLYEKVKAIVRVSNRRWDVVMENERTIQLPEKLPAMAWSRLASYANDYELFEKGFHNIDLRLEDKILIKFDDLETIRKPLPGQNT